jgi:hypothetical protein
MPSCEIHVRRSGIGAGNFQFSPFFPFIMAPFYNTLLSAAPDLFESQDQENKFSPPFAGNGMDEIHTDGGGTGHYSSIFQHSPHPH